tara:strand:- start:195 stop:653 length:459 start_codon:yes stop_codon:yes gene_type:complete
MDVVGYDKYMIYEDGRVWSKPKNGKEGKFLKPGVNNHGYYAVCLFNEDGIRKKMRIHRLVALHYIPNPENKPEVDHIDREQLNNNIKNLRWATRCENQQNKGAYGAVKFRGVCKSGNKFRAQITINGKLKHIGTYETAEEASVAYNNYIISS